VRRHFDGCGGFCACCPGDRVAEQVEILELRWDANLTALVIKMLVSRELHSGYSRLKPHAT
jgi:hypothetical protein